MTKSTVNQQQPTIAALIADRQMSLNITDAQLALAAGFEHPNMIAMIKDSRIKLPIDKVAALADALSVDPAHLLRTHMAESLPDVLNAVDALMASVLMTANETKLIENYRYLCRGRDVAPVIIDGSNLVALISV